MNTSCLAYLCLKLQSMCEEKSKFGQSEPCEALKPLATTSPANPGV